MADIAYENAVRRRDEIIRELREVEAKAVALRGEHQRVEAFIDQWHDFAGTPLVERSPTLVRTPARWVAHTSRVGKNSKKEEVAAAAYDIIASRNEPVARSELYRILTEERGLTIAGSDPEMVLSTMLWRMRNVITRLSGGGYWVADRDSPDGSYRAGGNNDSIHLAEMSKPELEMAIGGKIDDEEEEESSVAVRAEELFGK